MCFRPSEISLPVKCPECGTMNDPGTTPCTKCGAELSAAAMPGITSVSVCDDFSTS